MNAISRQIAEHQAMLDVDNMVTEQGESSSRHVTGIMTDSYVSPIFTVSSKYVHHLSFRIPF